MAAGVIFLLIADPSGRSLWACTVITLIAWAGALLMERAPPASTWYAVCLVAILGTWLGAELRGLMPFGIGIYGLHAIGYLTDVRYQRIKAERQFSRIALLHAFFPILPAGPIERAPTFLSSVRNLSRPRADFVRSTLIPAVALVGAGLFKQFVIARGLGLFVDPVYAEPEGFSANARLAAFALGFHRLYAELSGYADIAVGVGVLFGLPLSANFRRPLLAVSLTDFWQRWQITLASWMRDYVQVPMAGRGRAGAPYWILTFVLLGAWYGIEPRCLVFGLVHGVVVAFENWGGQAERTEKSRGARLWGLLVLSGVVFPSLLLLLCPNLMSFARIFQGIAQGLPGKELGDDRSLNLLWVAIGGIVALEWAGAWHARKPLLVRFSEGARTVSHRLRN